MNEGIFSWVVFVAMVFKVINFRKSPDSVFGIQMDGCQSFSWNVERGALGTSKGWP